MLGLKCPCSSNVKEDRKEGRYYIKETNLEFKIKYTIDDLDSSLSSLDSIFVQPKYLRLLEQNPSKNTRSIYVMVYENGTFLGVLYTQLTRVNLGESLNWDKKTNTFKQKIRGGLTKNISRNWLIVGSTLLTGNFGIKLKGKTPREAFILTDLVLQNTIPIIEKKLKRRISFLLYKDFTEEEAAQSEVLKSHKFTGFNAEPTMIMDIPKSWNSFEDYTEAISSKYKKRARRAFKKAESLQRVELSEEEILKHQDRIHELYEQISHNVTFNMVHLDKNYLLELKRKFKDDFTLQAYFLEDKMIGFCTAIKDHHETHAHFLGLDHEYNKEYQLYLNILYDLIQIAINNGSSKIDFARTAPEIKSSVGAIPQEMFLFIKHTQPVLNKLTPHLINRVLPKETEIIYRNPFKNTISNSPKKTKNKAKAVSDNETLRTENF